MYGGQNIIASGHDITQQTAFAPPGISQRDLAALLDYVRGLGVSEEDVAELQEVVKADRLPSEPSRLGPLAERWLGRVAAKGVEGTTAAAGGQIVLYAAKAIAQYYGLGLGT